MTERCRFEEFDGDDVPDVEEREDGEEMEGEGEGAFREPEGPQGRNLEERMVPRAFADGEGAAQEEITNAILGQQQVESDDLTEYQAKTPLVSKASQQFLNEQVNNRLTTALGAGSVPPQLPADAEVAEEITSQDEVARDLQESQDDIVTTAEELTAFNIVRAIVCNQVDMSRVFYRDAKSYCAILLDNNNRKTIARLHQRGVVPESDEPPPAP